MPNLEFEKPEGCGAHGWVDLLSLKQVNVNTDAYEAVAQGGVICAFGQAAPIVGRAVERTVTREIDKMPPRSL